MQSHAIPSFSFAKVKQKRQNSGQLQPSPIEKEKDEHCSDIFLGQSFVNVDGSVISGLCVFLVPSSLGLYESKAHLHQIPGNYIHYLCA